MFFIQILALVSLPELFNDPRFPEDVKKRAKDILNGCRGGSVGECLVQSRKWMSQLVKHTYKNLLQREFKLNYICCFKGDTSYSCGATDYSHYIRAINRPNQQITEVFVLFNILLQIGLRKLFMLNYEILKYILVYFVKCMIRNNTV